MISRVVAGDSSEGPNIGGALDSTPVTNPEVHAEMATNLVNPESQTYSCQRRQLRTRCLIPSRVPSDRSRACASGAGIPRDEGAQASTLTSSRQSSSGAEPLKPNRNRSRYSLPVG